jgi:signal peptidase II
MKKALLVIFLVLLFDQWLKLWVKTTFYLDEEVHIFGDWFRLHFTENPGMAFGLELGGEGSIWGKLVLRIFRIVAIILLGWYLTKLIKRNSPTGLIISIALILAGATGNIIDNAFYGMMFSDSYVVPATFMPSDGGYAGFLLGDVVDMLYFPLFTADLPWIGPFTFFSPIFNIADSAITVGVFILLLNQKKYFGTKEVKQENTVAENNSSDTVTSNNPGVNLSGE